MQRLKTQAMQSHFCWSTSAKHYQQLYYKALLQKKSW